MWCKVSSFVRNCHYDVLGLEPNKKYSFRVRAENQYGVSDPLETEQPIVAKFPFTVPDAPGTPRVVDWDSGNVTVTWDRPRSDGGSRIQGYKLEFRDVVEDQQWRPASDYLLKDQNYVVHSLLTGHEYEFRVRAKNAAGFSKPSSNSNRFKLKGKFGVPSPPLAPKIVKVKKRNLCDLEMIFHYIKTFRLERTTLISSGSHLRMTVDLELPVMSLKSVKLVDQQFGLSVMSTTSWIAPTAA
jgi:Fibronectin type III domain